jgi:predicted RNase H-like HicB family nuclease
VITIDDADRSLHEAMADYITRLVEDGLPVPPTGTTWAQCATVTA